MSKRQIIMLLGALTVAIALFSGLPASWNKILYIAIGVIVIGVAYAIKPAGAGKNADSIPYVDAHAEAKNGAVPGDISPIN